MADAINEQIVHLEQVVAVLQRRLHVLDLQCAKLGSHVPAHLVIEREDVAHQLEQTLASLHHLHPNSQADLHLDLTPQESPAHMATLFKRNVFLHRVALVSSFVAWAACVFAAYYKIAGRTPLLDPITAILTALFVVFFWLWYFSPVTNNSPKHRKYRKAYFRHLTYRHRDLDMKGLSTQAAYNLEQERIFVKLGLIPQPPSRISPGLIPPSNEMLPQGDADIWEYIRNQKTAIQQFAIIGAPGSGKTTLLKHITLTFVGGAHHRRKHRLRRRTPILLFLRDHAEQIRRNPQISLPQLVHRSLTPWNQIPPNGWFETELRNKHCIVLLDGLDEVADLQSRKHVVAWVERQMQTYAHNCFLITSRPVGYRSNTLQGVHVLEVRPFTGVQVRQFVENWYHEIEVMRSKKNDEGVRMRANEGAKDLLRRLSNAPALTELAANPLLLTMIATIHLYRSRLPRRRVELYAEICEVFLGKRRRVLDLDLDLAPMQKQRLLEPLAYHMMHNQQREIKVDEALRWIEEPLARVSTEMMGEDFLKMVEESSGLLLERESGVYSFAHQTFQEFLAAVHIERHQLTSELIAQVENSWWHETTLLYAARSDASDIIAACIQQEKPSIKRLTLAIECLNEAGSVQPALKSRIEKLLLQEVEDPDPERRHIVAEALVMQRLRRMARLNERRYIDTALVTHAEYQLFLDEQRKLDLYYQPDHWSGTHFPPGSGHMPVTGVRPSDAEAFCTWLTERDRSAHYQLPLAEEGEVYTKDVDGKLGYWVYRKPGFACEGITGIDITPIRMALAHRIADDLINLQLYALIALFTLVHQQARELVSTRPRERDLVDDHTQAQMIHDALDLAQKLMQVLIGTFDQATARDLTYSLTSARTLARQSAEDLVVALETAHASARALGQEPAQASAQDLDRARINARRSDRARANALANTTTLVNTLTEKAPHLQMLRNALTDDFAQNQELMSLFMPTSSYAPAIFEALAYGSEQTRTNLLVSPRPHIFIPTVERFETFVRSHAFVLDHNHAQDSLRVFDRSAIGRENQYTDTSLQRAYLRYWALLNSAMITPSQQGSQQSRVYQLQSEQQLQRLRMDVCYGLYLDLALLEERIAGRVPVVGGIRIVKELSDGPDTRE